MKQTAFVGAMLLGMAAMLCGCTFSDALRHDEIRSAWSLAQPATPAVFFVTDREPDASKLGFGLHWDAASHCGSARVVVPGAKGNPAEADVPKKLDCDGTQPFTALARTIAAAARTQGCDHVLVIVHGFNTVFRTALLRAGQVAADTQWPCATLLFSWSSEGKFDRYAADIERSGYAVPVLGAVLGALHDAGLKTDIFAQSMGARVTLAAVASQCGAPGLVGELVLAAPDVSAEQHNDDFEHFLKRTGACVRRVTLYASDNDMALVASEAIHGGVPRAGRVPRQDLQYAGTAYGNIVDVVDTGLAPGDPYGHGYYVLSYELMRDAMLVLAGVSTAQRAADMGTLACAAPCTAHGPYALVVAADRRPDWTSGLMRRLWPLIPRVQ